MFVFNSSDRVVPKRNFLEPPVFDEAKKLQAVMVEAVAQGASDIFITSGEPVLLEVHGHLHPLTAKRITTEEAIKMLEWAVGNNTASTRIARGEAVAAAYSVPDPDPKIVDERGARIEYRFRVNGSRITFRGGLGLQIVMRTINPNPPSLADVKMERSIVDAAYPTKGIVYFTGATGTGKSTSFAALIRNAVEGNTHIHGNICTLEAPIEYVYASIPSKSCIVVQQSVGPSEDCPSFADGVRDLMRRHPALAVVGEVRDVETAAAAVELSNTGHPVYATVHVNEVAMTFSRIAKLFPEQSRDTALADLISTTRLMVNQVLVPAIGGGRVALREYLSVSDDLRDQMMLEIKSVGDSVPILREMVSQFGRPMAVAAREAFEAGRISESEMLRYQRST